jgi:hypothetical protein
MYYVCRIKLKSKLLFIGVTNPNYPNTVPYRDQNNTAVMNSYPPSYGAITNPEVQGHIPALVKSEFNEC